MLFILLASLYPIILWCRMRSEIRNILAEAKNIELALRLTAIEYYEKDQLIYDSRQPDGLTAGTAQIIEELSGAEGKLTLGSWDTVRGAANRFSYATDRLIIVYNYDEREEEHWQIYYQLKDIEMPYGSGKIRE